jgi:hypothetical protein
LSQKSQLASEFASTSSQGQRKQLLHLGNQKLKHDHFLMTFFPFSEPTLMSLVTPNVVPDGDLSASIRGTILLPGFTGASARVKTFES